MSHIEEGKTTIQLTALAAVIRQGDPAAIAQHPCMALLRQAVALVAKAHDGSIQATYNDYDGWPQNTNINLALHIPGKLPRGIGLVIDPETGALTFKGDPWDHEVFFAEVQRTIVQNYVVLAHCAALRRMNAQVSTQTLDQQMVITGVFHG